jgi:predicted lipoprotein with Yx(FWY)xxD motif
VVPRNRIFIAAASALTATLSLAGCGSNDYGIKSADPAAGGAAPAYGGDPSETPIPADQLAQSNEAAKPGATPDADAQAGDSAGADADADADAESDADADADADTETAKPPKGVAKPVGVVTNRLIAKTVPRMGSVVTDGKGRVLYRFDKDKASPSKTNCIGDCAKLWPPLLADDTLELSGISASKVSTVERPDGGLQITIDGWPLYRYLGDKKAGEWNGQNVGGTSSPPTTVIVTVPPVTSLPQSP